MQEKTNRLETLGLHENHIKEQECMWREYHMTYKIFSNTFSSIFNSKTKDNDVE